MPFQSKAQQRLMFAKHPEIAKRWASKYGVPKNLPEHKTAKKKVLAIIKNRHGNA
jgi:hypothetical protein